MKFKKDGCEATLTDCRIRWADDGSEIDVVIKSTEDIGDDDDCIFFYGMSKEDCIKAMENKELCGGDWYIVAVYS